MANEPIPQGATLGEPIPAGATLGQPVQSGGSDGAIPQGATLGAPTPAANPQDPAEVAARRARSMEGKNLVQPEGDNSFDHPGGIATGFENEVGKTVNGAAALANRLLPASMQIPTSANNTTNTSTEEKVGGAAENIAEFVTGDAALDAALSKASKLVQAANASPALTATLKAAKNHPLISKIIEAGLRSGIVGGAQGGLKEAQEGDAAAGAEGGAIGGAVGGAAGELATPIAEFLGKKLGIGTAAAQDAKEALRPSNRNTQFVEKFKRAAPYLDAENKVAPAKTVEDWADHAKEARDTLYQNRIAPLIGQNGGVPLSGIDIANQVRQAITPEMMSEDPAEAQKIEDLANRFLPQNKFNLTMADAESRLQYYNAKLAATDYWKLSPSERAAMLKTNGTVAGLAAAGDAIRDEFYGKLNQLNPGVDIGELKKDYGALSEMENQIRGRVNVNDRQSRVSLKEMMGALTGIATGGAGGMAIAALPFLDREVNSAPRMLGRAVSKAANPGVEGTGTQVARAAGRGVKTVAPAVTAGGSRLIFTASDGSVHSVPADQINAAVQIDPGLQVHQ